MKNIVNLINSGEIVIFPTETVYGIGTKNINELNRKHLKHAVEYTGGAFYQHSNTTTTNIVRDIEKKSKSLAITKRETSERDLPTIPFMILLISSSIIIFYSKKVII